MTAAKRKISWEDLLAMPLVGRDLEILFEAVVHRAAIESITSDYFLVKPGGKCPANNFTKREDVAWRPYNFMTHPIIPENGPLPEMDEKGMISYRYMERMIIIHPEGDNLNLR